MGLNNFIGITKSKEKWYVFSNFYSDGKAIDIHDESDNLSDCFSVSGKLIRSYRGKKEAFKKRKEWLKLEPSYKQISIINKVRIKNINFDRINRYEATCVITYLFNRNKIGNAIKMYAFS